MANPGATVGSGALVTPGGAQGPPGATGPSGAGTGDMLKSVYDTNADNIVDHAALADIAPWAGLTGKPATFPPDSTAMLRSVYDANSDNIVDHAALADAVAYANVTGKPSTFPPDSTAELVARKAVASGYASLDAGTKVPVAQLPVATATIAGAVPTPPNNVTTFLRGDATFATPTGIVPSAHNSTHVTGGSDIIVPASASTAGLLKQLSGNTTDFVDGTNACQNLVTAIQPKIWSVRLASFNAVGNPNFEVTQRNCGTGISNPVNGTMIEDRWGSNNTALNAGFTSLSVGTAPGNGIVVPGTTNPAISTRMMRINVGTVKSSLAATDMVAIYQAIEGCVFRELMNDVSSISILASSIVPNLKFGLSLQDPTSSRSLTKLCTLGAASTWTLITLPNIPIWPGAGTFSAAPGVVGCYLTICAAAGSSKTSPANDTWQSGAFAGALGQSNLLTSTSNYLDIGFVQFEPGSVCTTLMDKPFTQNLDECQRYFFKTVDYTSAVGSAQYEGLNSTFFAATTTSANGYGPFSKQMAKRPSVNVYDPSTGVINKAFNMTTGSAISGIGSSLISDNSFARLTGTFVANNSYAVHYIADVGW